jgi:1,4-dihydroxy-2-naphthoyl-CoA synthase
MNENLKSIHEIKFLLKQYKASSGRGVINKVASDTQIDQSQVSRILSGKFVRVGPHVLKICKYAGLAVNRPKAKKKVISRKLLEAIGNTWDGTTESEEVLCNIINSIKPIVNRFSGGEIFHQFNSDRSLNEL